MWFGRMLLHQCLLAGLNACLLFFFINVQNTYFTCSLFLSLCIHLFIYSFFKFTQMCCQILCTSVNVI